MPSFAELRASLTERQRSLLTEIWKHFLSQNAWPISFQFHSPRRKAEVRDTLRPLNGCIVIEVSDHQHGSRYQLPLLGILLSENGPALEKLLARYLEYVRERYQTRPREQNITSSDVQKDLGLNDDESKQLGRLVVLAGLYTGSAGHPINWESKEWNAGMWRNVEDFPPEGSLGAEVERLTFQRYDAELPVLLQDRQGRAPVSVGTLEPPITSDASQADSRTVFVVHGRNSAARLAMFEFLRAIGLSPLEWSQIVAATGKPAPYVGEVLEKGFSMARAVVVLWTPDDEARLKAEHRKPADPPHEAQLTGQARPNVLFEAGMAMGLHPNRTVLVEVGELRPFTDVLGRHVIRLNNSVASRQDLADRLRTAGCPVDLSGRDWHTVGNFDAAQSATEHTEPPSGASWGSQPRVKGRMER